MLFEFHLVDLLLGSGTLPSCTECHKILQIGFCWGLEIWMGPASEISMEDLSFNFVGCKGLCPKGQVEQEEDRIEKQKVGGRR